MLSKKYLTGKIGQEKIIMLERDVYIEQVFPAIGKNYRLTSPHDFKYNCIAFAADDTDRWWWPGRYWPDGVPQKVDLSSFIACYNSIGYVDCNMDSSFELGYEKVAIFVGQFGFPTHAAKQSLDGSGLWKSKLGEYKDIEHTIDGISGIFHRDSYGNVSAILKRKTQ